MAAEQVVVTELTVDARGAEIGSAQYIRAMNAAQSAIDRLIDRQRAQEQATESGNVVMLTTANSIGSTSRAWDRLRASIDPTFSATKKIEEATLLADRAMRLLGTDAEEVGRVLAAVTLHHDAAASAARKQADEYLRLAAAGREALAADRAQGGFNAVLGVRAPSSGSARASASVFEESAREADRVAAQVATLRAELDPLAAAQSRVNAEIAEYSVLAQRGAISAEEFARAQMMARARLDAPGSDVGLAARRAAGVNAGQQLQDTFLMAFSGQPSQMTALQQGPQLASAIQAGGGIGALKDGLASLISPTMLLTVGFVGATSAAVQYFTKTRDQADKTKDLLKQQQDAIRAVRDLWGEAAEAQSKYGRGTTSGASIGLDRSIGGLTRELRTGVSGGAVGQEITTLINQYLPRSGLGAREFRETSIFQVLKADFDQLHSATINGEPDILRLIRNLEDIGTRDSNGALRALAQEAIYALKPFRELAEALRDAKLERDRLFNAVGPNGMALSQGSIAQQGDAAYSRYLAQQDVARQRSQAAFDAEKESIRARTITERANAAIARESAIYPADEGVEDRRVRIERAGLLELARAEQEVEEATRSRSNAQRDALEQYQVEAEGIGKTAGEQAQLNAYMREYAKLREESERTGLPISDAAVENARQFAKAIGAAAEANARLRIADDVNFDRAQIFRNSEDQQIASSLRGTGLGLNSGLADAMRENNRLADYRALGVDLLSGIRDGLLSGSKNVGEVILDAVVSAGANYVGKMTDRLIEDAVTSGMKLLGLDVPGIDSQTVGSMSVTAASVTVTGSLGADVARMFSPANGNDAWGGLRGGAPVGAVERSSPTQGGAAGTWGDMAAAGMRAPLGGGSVASQAWDFFKGKGLADHQVAGILGNIKAESAFNPKAVGDAGQAFGLFQHNDRKWNLFRHVGGMENLGDVQGQLDFAWKELQGPERQAFNALMASRDVRSATAAFAGFERPSGFSWQNPEGAHNFSGRLSGAEAALEQFGGKVSSAAKAAEVMATKSIDAGAGAEQLAKSLTSMFPGEPGAAQGGGGGWGGIASLVGNFLSPSAWGVVSSGRMTGLFHEGGIAGFPTQFRSVDPRVFIGAPRYHEGGIAGDEVPAILRRGEPVFKSMEHARQVVGGGGTTINVQTVIHNASGAQVRQETKDDGKGGKRQDIYIDEAVAQSISRPGSRSSQALSQMGARAPLVRR